MCVNSREDCMESCRDLFKNSTNSNSNNQPSKRRKYRVCKFNETNKRRQEEETSLLSSVFPFPFLLLFVHLVSLLLIPLSRLFRFLFFIASKLSCSFLLKHFDGPVRHSCLPVSTFQFLPPAPPPSLPSSLTTHTIIPQSV